ncbi:acetolactate synthase-1/3 small subunit [Chryseobacterium sp. H1D6B]|uniref:acetolactate synthase small subunit n=1 Tax=Chryseobacterium sp. H1D6B TaxID=2940588 RepID=UPI0015C8DA08|nr:acetolactate synthase small subunit [Chryseobacterium sp. H1D6B]MDH6253022.1 acetolactate synthase-1/3 small subunit [Chryseobacterium sp. H1D6B]
MNEEKKEYMITAHIENYTGFISRISNIFSRRRINIVSLHAGPSEKSDSRKLIVVVKETEEVIEKLTRQIEKQVDVLEVSYHQNPRRETIQHAN